MINSEFKELSTDPSPSPAPGPSPSVIIPTEIKLSDIDVEHQTYEDLRDDKNIWYVTISSSSLYGRDYRIYRKFDRYDKKGIQIKKENQPWSDESKVVSITDIFENTAVNLIV